MQQWFMAQTCCDMTFEILIPLDLEGHDDGAAAAAAAAAAEPPAPPQSKGRGRKRKVEEEAKPPARKGKVVEIKAHSVVLASRSNYIK